MNNIIKFHRSFNKLWKYRLENMETFTLDMHRVILHLSICDYHLDRDRKITLDDYEYVKKRMDHFQDFINKDKLVRKHLNICLEIVEAFILMEKII